MRISDDWLRRQVASCLVMFLAAPFGRAAVAPSPQAAVGQQAVRASSAQPQAQDSGSEITKPSADVNLSAALPGDAPLLQATDQDPQSGSTSQAAPAQQQNAAPNPVGAAAAPYQKTTGVPASRPAGVVIAPAKQRRARSILIKVGLILGAAVAVGTVVALSSASPSKPH